MKSARELFKELGYKKLPKKYNKNMILYENKNMELDLIPNPILIYKMPEN